jgi:hypothetical protein
VVRRRVAVSLAVAAVLAASVAFASGGAGAGATGTAAATSSSSGITFGAPVVVDTVHTYGEPDLKFDPSNPSRVYASGPWGTGTQRSIWDFSQDGGHTFHPIHDTPLTGATQSDSQHTGPGGGDTEISIDHNGNAYYADLAALATLKVAKWNPNANPRTLTTGFFGNSNQGANGVDRQWFALWDPPANQVQAVKNATGYTGTFPVNYLVYSEALAGCCEAAAYSTDGTTYNGPTTEFSIGSDGPAVIDQQTGTVMEAVGVSGGVGVAILNRGPNPPDPTDPSLTVSQVVKAADLPSGDDVGALFPTIAMDQARNAYLVWVTRDDNNTVAQRPSSWQIYYSYATAASGWKTWSAPRQLSKPPAVTNIMPWSVAGSAGRLAAVWYGTNDNHDPSGTDVHQAWDVYVATVTNAASSSPSIRQTKATPHPMHYGTICLAGTGCIASQGNRNLADFFEVDVDPSSGAISIVYDDTSNELTQAIPQGPGIPPPIDGSADHRGAPVVTLIKQNSGPGLYGTDVDKHRQGGVSLNDPTGDAHFDPVYNTTTSIPQLDLLGYDIRADGSDIVFRLPVKDLHNLANAVTATGGQAVDYVFRWSGKPVVDPSTGTKIPVYYVAAEVDSSGNVTYFAGTAISYELCSVSGCEPHIMDYPAPPYGGTAVTGKVTFIQPDRGQGNWFIIRVPRSLIGSPADGTTLDSLGAYTYARNRSASIPITNVEAQTGVVPISIDGVCCINAAVKSTAH